MTRDDVIRLAKEAGFRILVEPEIEWIERFAALVAAAEREACVTPADRLWAKGPGVVTAAIRANGYKVES